MRKTIIIIVMIIIRTIMTKIVIKHQEKCNHNQKGGAKDCDNNLNCVWVFFFNFGWWHWQQICLESLIQQKQLRIYHMCQKGKSCKLTSRHERVPLHVDFCDLTKTGVTCLVWVKFSLALHCLLDKDLAYLLSVKQNGHFLSSIVIL